MNSTTRVRTQACSLAAAALLTVAAVNPSAHAVTTIGSNFDSNLSLIYDTGSGNVFLENAPLPNPAVQQLVIASAGGLLLPGNLNVPVLAPAVTVTSATPSLIDFAWASGNFLGTGSFIGNLLGPSIPQATLLADLTLSWAPVSSPLVAGDLLYGTFGTTQGNPVLPGTTANGFFRFFNVQSGQFFDPPMASGFLYEMTSGALFTKLGLPIGYGNSFDVLVGNVPVATGLAAGAEYLFPGGVSAFSLVGINPAVDAVFGDAFPLYLEFNTPTASFNMTAIPVPEPTAVLLLAGGLMAAVRRRGFARG